MALAKGALEQVTITLIGEVSEVSNKPGYKAVYFSVKDEGATMPCMMWMNRYHSAGVELTVGALVQLTGRFTLYAPKGRMNFDVFSLSLAGEGNLRAKVDQLARKLQAEGLMDTSRKRALPSMPRTIGVVTSPRGAAVHDVLRTLRRRWPAAQVVLAGVPVEGPSAPAALIEGLTAVVQAGADVVLLVRGGGSFEDLMPFNDEQLARTIASLPVPVVTGIGHEPDTSIADMVADRRASTPTAAAEAVSPDITDLHAQLSHLSTRMQTALRQGIERNTLRFEALANRSLFLDPQQLYATEAQTLDYLEERLSLAIPAALNRDTAHINALGTRLQAQGSSLVQPFEHQMALRASRLDDLSPLKILSRGYSLVHTPEGDLVTSYADAPIGSSVKVRLDDGTLTCDVTQSEPKDIDAIDWKE